MTKAQLKTASKAPAKTATPTTSNNKKKKSAPKSVSKPFYTWRVEYWTDGPARIGSDYFRSLDDMFKVIEPKTFIDKRIDLASMPVKRIEVTVIENTGKRSNGQICSAFNLTVAAVGVSSDNKINLFPFYSDDGVINALRQFQKELEKHRAGFKRLFRLNQTVEARN